MVMEGMLLRSKSGTGSERGLRRSGGSRLAPEGYPSHRWFFSEHT
ncbi:hypothetical protein ACFPRL_27840 [Pseudoclavibacter helvolus]